MQINKWHVGVFVLFLFLIALFFFQQQVANLLSKLEPLREPREPEWGVFNEKDFENDKTPVVKLYPNLPGGQTISVHVVYYNGRYRLLDPCIIPLKMTHKASGETIYTFIPSNMNSSFDEIRLLYHSPNINNKYWFIQCLETLTANGVHCLYHIPNEMVFGIDYVDVHFTDAWRIEVFRGDVFD